MNTPILEYKEYKGQIEIDVEAGIIFGRVLDIRDVVTFKGETIAEVTQAFHDSVNDYLDYIESDLSAAMIQVMALDFLCVFCSALWSFSESSDAPIGEFAPVIFGMAIAMPGRKLS